MSRLSPMNPVFAAVPPGVVIKRICDECHRSFDPHVYPSATCYSCEEKLAARKARWVEAHRPKATPMPPVPSGPAPGATMNPQYNAFAEANGWGTPAMQALHAMDGRLDKLQDGLTRTIKELRTDKLALTARAEEAEAHPEIVAATTLAHELEEARLFAAEQREHERQVARREQEEAAMVVVWVLALFSATVGIWLALGLAAAFCCFAVLAVAGFVTWRERRLRADHREDAMATLARNRAAGKVC